MVNDIVCETPYLSNLEEEQQPLVSVSILTYNHEKFIGKAIESVLAQEVDFDYEIVIAEDYSTDRTREIVVEYAQRYPKLIRLILQEQNMGISGNSNSLRRACRGYFRAHLEGDDYWCDRKKLKRQVDFLINHPEYIAIGGAFECYDEREKRTSFPWGKISSEYALVETYTMEHIKKWLLPAHASTLTYRNLFKYMNKEQTDIYESAEIIGDRKLALLLASRGYIRYESRIVLHRHVLVNSKSSYTSQCKTITNHSGIVYSWLCEAEKMMKNGFRTNLNLSERKKKSWIIALKSFGKTPSRTNLKVLREIFGLSNCKAHYIKIAAGLLRTRIKEKKRQEGTKALLKSFIVYPIKALRRRREENRKDSEKQKAGQKFINDNVKKK